MFSLSLFIREELGERAKIKVHQVIHNIEGKLLADEMVDHFLRQK